jgi:transcriptional antiterminator RfaH
MNNFIPGWYLLYTKPRHEKKVSSQLDELKIRCFLPTKRVLRTWHDRKKYIDEPLFPSYVFIYLEGIYGYYEGKDVEGVLYFVRSGKEIIRVNETVVNNIQLIANKTYDVEVSFANFESGRQLVIREGPLAGLSCEVIRLNNQKKILVRVQLLSRNLLVSLSPEHLLAVSD